MPIDHRLSPSEHLHLAAALLDNYCATNDGASDEFYDIKRARDHLHAALNDHAPADDGPVNIDLPAEYEHVGTSFDGSTTYHLCCHDDGYAHVIIGNECPGD